MENWKVIQRSTAKTTHTIKKKLLTWILQRVLWLSLWNDIFL